MRTLLIVCALLSAGLLSGPADARSRERKPQQQEQQQQPRENRVQRRDDSAEAARRAQAQNGGGRVLSVEPEGSGYRVKVLKDGEVRVHHVDPN